MADSWRIREQKGRIAEDIVCLGFRLLGYKVLRIGIEHTESVKAYEADRIYEHPLFQQARKTPDFLMVKGKGPFRYLEVKFRSNSKAHETGDFMKKLATSYLGKPQQDKQGKWHRKGSKYFEPFRDTHIILITPKSAHIAKLGNLIYKKPDESYDSSKFWQEQWGKDIDEDLMEDWGKFLDYFTGVTKSLAALEWDDY